MSEPKKIKLEKCATEDDNNFHDSDDSSGDSIVGLDDLIADQHESNERLTAVYGASNWDECSYANGYMKRQAIFACADCCDLKKEPAGVCLACANSCHDGHNVYELYTKRNFRCDCGNDKFPNFQCQLDKHKALRNVFNNYNHNFEGLYCSCKRTYPDSEFEKNLSDTESEMIQCVACEDWFHNVHLGAKRAPVNQDYEMICQSCTERCCFLGRYKPICISDRDFKENINVEELSKAKSFYCGSYNSQYWLNKCKQECDGNASTDSNKRKADEDSSFPRVAFEGASFWPNGWRSCLCQCKDCMIMYQNLKVEFIIEDKDTLQAYEEQGSKKVEGKVQTAIDQLNEMPRTTQIALIEGVNSLRDGLRNFFDKFRQSGEEVTSEHVNDFFAKFKENKQNH